MQSITFHTLQTKSLETFAIVSHNKKFDIFVKNYRTKIET